MFCNIKLNTMKNNILKFGLIAFITMVMVGCNKDENVMGSENDTVSIEEAQLVAKLDNTSEVVSDVLSQTFEFEETASRNVNHPYLPDCATVTVAFTGTLKEVIVDFGTEGCEVRNGNILKGKLIMSYQLDLDVASITIAYGFEDFFVDDDQLLGSKTVVRQRENENGNPQYTMNMDFSVVFSDGTEASRTGTKTREWIEGAFNGNWGDNVFEISGAWETNFANGALHSATITAPLRREASCRFLVSGVIELIRTNVNGSLNYGDGACDNEAVFTNEDGEETLVLT